MRNYENVGEGLCVVSYLARLEGIGRIRIERESSIHAASREGKIVHPVGVELIYSTSLHEFAPDLMSSLE